MRDTVRNCKPFVVPVLAEVCPWLSLVGCDRGGADATSPGPAAVARDRARVEHSFSGRIAAGVVETDPERSRRRVDGRRGPELIRARATRGRGDRDPLVVRPSEKWTQPAVERLQEDALVAAGVSLGVREVDPPRAGPAGAVDGNDRVRMEADEKRGPDQDPRPAGGNRNNRERFGLALRLEVGAAVRRPGDREPVAARVVPGDVDGPVPRDGDAGVRFLVAGAVDLHDPRPGAPAVVAMA